MNKMMGFIAASLVAFLAPSGLAAQAGGVGPGFNIGTGFSEDVTALFVRPDGKVLVGLEQRLLSTDSRSIPISFDGTGVGVLALLNANGSLDGSFTPPTFVRPSQLAIGARISAIAVDNAGGILVG